MSFANEVKVFDFTEVELSKLEVRKVRGADKRTIYTVAVSYTHLRAHET